MLTQPKVLMLSSEAAESSALYQLLSEHVILQSVKDLPGLVTALESHDYDAILCGWSFHQGCWNHALEWVQQWRPELPVIIFSGQAGEREWLEVLEAGGFDLLNAPYMKSTVLPTLEHAVISYEARRLHRSSRLTSAVS